MTVQFIEIGGEKIAVMPAADYERLIADAEDKADIQAAIAAEARRVGGEDYLPVEVVDQLLAGESPLRVWRKHRGMTLQALSQRAGISLAYLSQIEKGERDGTLKAWRTLAAALDLDIEDIVPRDSD